MTKIIVNTVFVTDGREHISNNFRSKWSNIIAHEVPDVVADAFPQLLASLGELGPGCSSKIPQTVLALRGSNGVGKGALKPPLRRSRCRSAFFLVIYSTW